MKTIIITLLFLGLGISSYSQDKMQKEDGMVNVEELPAIVIKKAGEDFSVYIPDNHPDKDVREIEKKFIAYDIGKDYENYENYLLVLETKTGTLSAKYNDKGKLLGVVENYENIRLPNEVIYSVYKNYPGWKIVKDKYLYTQKEGDVLKKQYHLRIKKDDKSRMLTIHANGDIIKD